MFNPATRGLSTRYPASASPVISRSATTASPASPAPASRPRSEEHTSELQSRFDLVCRLLLEKKKKKTKHNTIKKSKKLQIHTNIINSLILQHTILSYIFL